MPKTINTGVKLDETLHTRIKNLSTIKERSPHWLMKAAIEEYVAREEAYEQEKRADQERWQRYILSDHAIAKDSVNSWLESWGSDKEFPCPQ